MHDGGPEHYPMITYAWVILLSAWGGMVNFYRKVVEKRVRPFNVIEFIGEIATSILVGLITFYLAESAQIDQVMTAAMVAVSGHMGARLIYQFERIAETKLSKYAGTQSSDSRE